MKLTGPDSVLAALVLKHIDVVRAYALATDRAVNTTDRRGEIRVRCPSRDHPDVHPSCDLRPADNVWRCYTCPAQGGILTLAIVAGHAQNDAEAARWFADKLGIELPPNRQQRRAEERAANKGAQKIVATYLYRDLEEAVRYEVLRYGPVKDFKVRHRDANGKTVWSLNGVERIPFAWPEMANAIARDEAIVVCEGEKAAKALSELGFIATCSQGGAKWVWTPAFAELFRGARVVFLADNDPAGRDAVDARSQVLIGVAREVRAIIQLPDAPAKGDCYDLIEAGWTAEQFAGLFAAAVIVEPVPAQVAVAESQRESTTSEPPPEPVDGAALLDEVVQVYRRFVLMSPAQSDALALYVIHTHAIGAAEVTPYILLRSPEKRCGKTLTLLVSQHLCRKVEFAANVTPAALFRLIDAEQPTYMIDEIDTIYGGHKSERNEDLRAVLNAGFERGATIPRCVGPMRDELRRFKVFCPKMLAGLRCRLPDTLLDRCIILEMQRKPPGSKVSRFHRRRSVPELHALRDRVATWATQNLEALEASSPELPDDLNDRARDIWEALFAIADNVGGEWPVRARRAALVLSGEGTVEDESRSVRLLADVRDYFGLEHRTASAELVRHLVGLEESPWGHLDARGLARILRPFGIRPRTIRLDDGSTPKGYLRECFTDSFSRYLTPTPGNPPQPTRPPQRRKIELLDVPSSATNGAASQTVAATGPAGANPRGGQLSATSPHTPRENHDEIRAAADVADVALSADARGELSDRSKLCRQCKTLDLAFDMGDRTWLCRACAEGEV